MTVYVIHPATLSKKQKKKKKKKCKKDENQRERQKRDWTDTMHRMYWYACINVPWIKYMLKISRAQLFKASLA